jgi:hypothetical protein
MSRVGIVRYVLCRACVCQMRFDWVNAAGVRFVEMTSRALTRCGLPLFVLCPRLRILTLTPGVHSVLFELLSRSCVLAVRLPSVWVSLTWDTASAATLPPPIRALGS